ncbi:MAG: FtsW/RodA/SpoVE family cell cycle protein [Candidatus Cloacimonadota bacterium]|nr:FtsW/RodA/SpoVE family cell cycle protein [Candidatus Cloacimonadota bacterium]
MRNRELKYDYWIIGAYFILLGIGFFTRFNIISSQPELTGMTKLIFLMGLSIFIVFLLLLFGSTKFISISFSLIFFAIVIALIYLITAGEVINGAKRFLLISGFSLQPSLIIKVLLIFYSAKYISNKQEKFENIESDFSYRRLDYFGKYWFDIKFFFLNYWRLLTIFGILYLMIIIQPHLSIIIISSLTIIWMLWFGNVKTRTLLTLFFAGLFIIFLILHFGKEYRGRRLMIYKKYNLISRIVSKNNLPISFGKENIEGERQVRESLAALSKGEVFGTFSMSKEEYLSESSTDYIFSVIGEQGGFFLTIILFVLYSLIFYKTVSHAYLQKDSYKRILLIGLGLNIYINVLINTGVAMSILPSTGVTLPLISSGGSSIIANSICIGMILNLSKTKERVVR